MDVKDDENCILNYTFDDEGISEVHMFTGQRVALCCDGLLQLCEDDVIALACHYGITERQILAYKFRDANISSDHRTMESK